MHYVASASPPSVVLSALKSNFITSEIDCLILNKLNRLEVYTLQPDPTPSLQLALEIPIYGSIAYFTSINLPGHATSTLIVLTTALDLFSLEYSASSPHSVITTSSTCIKEAYARLSEFQTILFEPRGRCLVVLAYQGMIQVIPLSESTTASSGKKGNKNKKMAVDDVAQTKSVLDLTMGYNIRLPALNLTSLEFLPATIDDEDDDVEALAVLALIYGNHLGQRVLQSYAVDLEDKELVQGPIQDLVLTDQGSEKVLVVDNSQLSAEGGVVVIGEESLRWVSSRSDEEKKGKGKESGAAERIECKMLIGSIQACTAIMDTVDKYLLGDIYGKLFLLSLLRANRNVTELILKDLGDTSSPTSIVSLTPSLMYIASRFADSQLIRLPAAVVSPDSMDEAMEEEDISLIASYTSLAPILDCCIVESDGGGASSVVTCSGAYKGGSLRIIRQGVGLDELAALEMDGAQRVFSLKSGIQDLLVLSFFNATQILSFADSPDAETDEDVEEIEEIDLASFVTTTATLLAGNLGTIIFQVTSVGINYSDSAIENDETKRWTPDAKKKITLASSDGTFVAAAIEGGELILLHIVEGKLIVSNSSQLSNEIACLSIAHSHLSPDPLLSVGLWTSQTVLLFSLPTLSPLLTQIIDTEYLIRSIVVVDLGDDATYLFAGLGDGRLTSYVIGQSEDGFAVEKNSKKTVVLGTRPIVMAVFEAEEGGSKSIFVSSDRPTVVSRKSDRLVYSSVNLKEINSLTPFSTPLYPSALALISPVGLQIGRIRSIQHVDIRTVPLEEDEPRRIAHDAKSKSFGVVCSRRDVNRLTGEQTTKGVIKIMEDGLFKVLADIPLQLNEEGQSITVVTLSSSSTIYVVGTALIDESEVEPTKGRLLLVAEKVVKGERTFEVVGQREIKGCAYALCTVAGPYLAAAVNSQVIVYSISEDFELTPLATWGGSFISLNLTSRHDTLLVGDAMRSITLLRFTPSPPSMIEIARDYNAHYMAAVESLAGHETDSTIVAGEEFIGAEIDLNLFTVQKEDVTTSRSMTDEMGLGERGGFHLGEIVAKFCRGSLVQQFSDNASTTVANGSPRLVYATSAGSLGVVADLSPTSSKLLSDLERNMRKVIKGVGELSQESWRSFKTDHKNVPSSGFVDGDFIELLPTLTDAQIDEIISGGDNEFERLTASREEVLRLVEECSRMH